MSDAVICPTQQQLAAFGLGKLPEQEVAAVAAHLEACSKCTLAVAALTKDSFVKKVRDANLGGSSFPPNPPRPANTPPNVGRQTPPASLCPNLPPELANHPKYRILRELGRGGMGVVYQARQTGMMDRPVVIKVINRALLDNPDALERFLREAQAAGKLSHPNIVTAYDSEKAGELHMLVMEFVPGQNLAEVLEKKGPFPVVYACHFARQVALGLQHAHERGMVHRDIKPQNLILSLKNHVKILDFGLAKIASESGTGTGLTSTNAYMGTPEYSAPEQAEDARNADIRADLYSLGCTLYCLLAGRPPFREDTWVKTVLAHIQKAPQPLPELRSDVPERLWRVIARLLAKKREQRYQKPLEVVQALAPFVKPGAKPLAKSGPVPVVASPGKNTMLAADTNQIKKVLQEVTGKAPPEKVPAANEASPFADLTDASAAPKEVVRVQEKAKPSRTAWWKRPGVVAAAVGVSLALILMAVIIIKVKMQPTDDKPGKPAASNDRTGHTEPHSADAIVVLEIDQPGAEVFVDGQKKIAVKVPGDKEPIEITVEPGRHRVEVKKSGFKVHGEEVTLENGERHILTAKLEKMQLPPRVPPADPDGFVPLFNGKDLTGWTTQFEMEGGWHVEDGVLFWSRRERGFLRTDRNDFTDFHLKVELRISDRQYAQLYVPGGYVLALNSTNNNSNKTGSLFAPSRRWMTFSKSLVRPDQWFTLEVIVKGNHVVVKVAGQTTADFPDPERRFARGFIELAGANHATERRYSVEYRKIEIKEFPLAVEPGKENDAETFIKRGLALLHKGDVDGAIVEFRRAIQLNKDFHAAHFNLGNALVAKGDLDGAITSFRKGIALKPDDAIAAVAHNNLGNALIRQGKHAEAEEALRKAITLKPDLAEAYDNLGEALNIQRRHAEAAAAYRKAISLKVDFAPYYYNLGIALGKQKQYAGAEAAYRQAIALKPDFAEAHCNLGHALREQGEFRQALEEMRRGHELGSKVPGWKYPSAEWVRQLERLVPDQRVAKADPPPTGNVPPKPETPKPPAPKPDTQKPVDKVGVVIGKVVAVNEAKKTLRVQLQGAKNKNVEVEWQATDDVNVRMQNPPPQFDDKGRVKRYTAKELRELKGNDQLPGYPAEFSDLKPGQDVQMTLIRKKGGPRQPKDAADPTGEYAPHMSLIVIRLDPKNK